MNLLSKKESYLRQLELGNLRSIFGCEACSGLDHGYYRYEIWLIKIRNLQTNADETYVMAGGCMRHYGEGKFLCKREERVISGGWNNRG
jgi:hypothetical protein